MIDGFFFYKIPLNLRITTADDIFMYQSTSKIKHNYYYTTDMIGTRQETEQ